MSASIRVLHALESSYIIIAHAGGDRRGELTSFGHQINGRDGGRQTQHIVEHLPSGDCTLAGIGRSILHPQFGTRNTGSNAANIDQAATVALDGIDPGRLRTSVLK